MSQPFVGEIRLFAGNFAPVGWNFCDGSLLSISENETLFNLIGTTYGGDGQSTFALPDMRGRLPIHFGGGFNLAQTGGAEEVTITTQTMATHSHPFIGTTSIGGGNTPANALVAQSSTVKVYSTVAPTAALGPLSISSVGGNQPHTNFQPYLCINFIISLFGIFPSQT